MREFYLEDKEGRTYQPSKIVCVGQNYLAHIRELGNEVPPEPVIFLKPPSALIGDGEQIILPELSNEVHYEGELAVVVLERISKAKASDFPNMVLGYTCANDVTARDLQRKDGQWTRSKGFDTFCPVGPVIVREIDPCSAQIICRVNGEIKQDGNSSDMIRGVPELIEFISAVMTLYPGDLILTGTPPGVGELHRGDVVEVEIPGIGILRNTVV